TEWWTTRRTPTARAAASSSRTSAGSSGCMLGAIRYAASTPRNAASGSRSSARPTGRAEPPRSRMLSITARPVLPRPPTTAYSAVTPHSSEPVDVGGGLAAAEPGVARTPVEERLLPPGGATPVPLGAGGVGVVAQVVGLQRPGQHHAVVL